MRCTADLRLRLQQTPHAIAGFVGECYGRLLFRVMLSLAGMFACLFVKMNKIFAKSPAQSAHADVHPQIHPLPPRELNVK